jgi:hypothetical protein
VRIAHYLARLAVEFLAGGSNKMILEMAIVSNDERRSV